MKITTKHLAVQKNKNIINYDAIMEMCVLIFNQYFRLVSCYSFESISSQLPLDRQTYGLQTHKQVERMTVLVLHCINSTIADHRHFPISGDLRSVAAATCTAWLQYGAVSIHLLDKWQTPCASAPSCSRLHRIASSFPPPPNPRNVNRQLTSHAVDFS